MQQQQPTPTATSQCNRAKENGLTTNVLQPTPPPFTTTYSPGPRVPLVPSVGDRQVVPLVSGRITLQSGKWGLNPVEFPKTAASTENELGPLLESRWAGKKADLNFPP